MGLLEFPRLRDPCNNSNNARDTRCDYKIGFRREVLFESAFTVLNARSRLTSFLGSDKVGAKKLVPIC